MTTSDLKENRNRIIRNIRYQEITEMSEIAKVMILMLEMVNWQYYANAKTTMKNIDALTKAAVIEFVKSLPAMSASEFEEIRRKQMMQNLPSSMR